MLQGYSRGVSGAVKRGFKRVPRGLRRLKETSGALHGHSRGISGVAGVLHEILGAFQGFSMGFSDVSAILKERNF